MNMKSSDVGGLDFVRAMVASAVTLGACVGAQGQSTACLSDEFDSAASIAGWTRVEQSEGWNTEPLAHWSVNSPGGGVLSGASGRMVMVPHTVTWYQDYRGPIAYKDVSGNFAITARVRATGRDGVSVPNALFSLAGVMIRTPRAITPMTWTPSGENYVFLSVGYGNAVPRRFQYEVKTTINGNSQLVLSNAPSAEAVLQIVRIGSSVICLRQEAGVWLVHARYTRTDLPTTVQAGLVAYTDWAKVSTFTPVAHNTQVLVPGVVDPSPAQAFAPDLRAEFEYARFAVPVVPAWASGLNLSNPAQVNDAALLTFLGASLDVPASGCVTACSAADIANTDGQTTLDGGGPDGAIDNGDFSAYFSAFFASEGDPARMIADIANTDGQTTAEGGGPDGMVDNGDFTAFFAAFFVGCV
jgi:hypothetical protein